MKPSRSVFNQEQPTFFSGISAINSGAQGVAFKRAIYEHQVIAPNLLKAPQQKRKKAPAIILG